jgi:hypothetical protein
VDLAGTNVERLGKEAFALCFGLMSVALPSSLREIGSDCFWETGLRELNLSGTCMVEFSLGAFRGASRLTSLAPPATLSFIDMECFSRSGVTRLDFSATGLIRISGTAFADAHSLMALVFPSTLERIVRVPDVEGFSACALGMPDLSGTQLQELEGDVFSRGAMGAVIPPETMRRLGDFCFAECQVERVLWRRCPPRAGVLGNGCFRMCRRLRSPVLPARLLDVGERVVEGCGALEVLDIGSASQAAGGDVLCEFSLAVLRDVRLRAAAPLHVFCRPTHLIGGDARVFSGTVGLLGILARPLDAQG